MTSGKLKLQVESSLASYIATFCNVLRYSVRLDIAILRLVV